MKIFAAVVIFSVFFSAAAPAAEKKDFRQLRSEHFLINYRQDVSQSYVYKIKDKAEGFYRIITHEFNLMRDEFWLWENRAVIFIAKDKQDYLDSFECSSWSGACVDYRGKVIYTYPDQERFVATLAHELTHIIFREYLGRGSFPLWLDEGVAAYIEDKRGGGSYRDGLSFLKKKIKEETYIGLKELNQVSISGLNEKSEEYVNLFYLEAFSLVNFIKKKYGEYSFSRFLHYLRKGEPIEKSLSRISYYLKNFENLEKMWKKFYQE